MRSSAGASGGFRYGMRAFRHRDFRIFFAGALASNSGNWLQNLSVPYVLYQLTGKSLWVGLAGFAQFIPSFALGPLGGSLADRLDRRTILLVSQSLMALASLMLWAAWVLGWHNPYLLLALTGLTGVFSGLMIPSWQAFVPSLVPKSDLPSAITLNSTQFNASRAVGPALAGLLLAVAGPGWAFGLNGLSFLAVLGSLWVIRARPSEIRPAPGPTLARTRVTTEFRAALGYIGQRNGLRMGILTALLIAFFGNPVTQFTVVLADQVYDAGAEVVGLLAAGMGIGAVLAAPLLSVWDSTVPRSTVVRWGLPTYALSVIAFGLAPNWPLGLAALLMTGAGFLAVIATTNTAMQMIVADHMRGRVLSARVMGFTLAYPFGALIQGALADVWGPQVTVTAAGSCLLVLSGYLATRPELLADLDREDDTPDTPVTV